MSSTIATLGRARRFLIGGELACGFLVAIGLLLVSTAGFKGEFGAPTVGAKLLLASSAAFCGFWFPLLYHKCFGVVRPRSSRRILPLLYWLLVGIVLAFWLFLAAVILLP